MATREEIHDDLLISNEQKQRVEAWFKNKFSLSSRPCPVCGVIAWQIAPHLVSPMGMKGNDFIPSIAYPHLMVICMNCAYTLFFNAGLMGIIEKTNTIQKAGEAISV